MYKKILKSYKCAKDDIDRWYRKLCRDKEEYKEENAIECIGCIGKALSLARILDLEFNANVKDECMHMKQIEKYIKTDVLGI